MAVGAPGAVAAAALAPVVFARGTAVLRVARGACGQVAVEACWVRPRSLMLGAAPPEAEVAIGASHPLAATTLALRIAASLRAPLRVSHRALRECPCRRGPLLVPGACTH
eukprot:CAMPEP_0183465490 /NCGR_PEP_ID=MMETSP0370-20130417/147332_1 /TAXON_ID=268820 /ORGANISM="Peridinium aciculiferum, Strain PAER-2" /LENGTH=109 /DNA_ID=CAMNT_0025657701 /DNA_START=301 /DNA_END=627 /DNA_ORIENTATION=-